MARFVPRVVQTLITQTPDATRVRDTLTQGLQPVLDFLNGYFVPAADGSLQILRNITATANAVIAGTLVVQGTTTLNGATTVNAPTTLNGATTTTAPLTVNSTSQLNGTLTVNGSTLINNNLGVTGAANLSATLLVQGAATLNGMVTVQNDVNCTGTTTANSLVSRTGIPEPLDCGVFWNSSAAASTIYPTYKNVANQSTAIGATAQGTTPFFFRFPRAGSIIGVSLCAAGTAAGNNLVYYFKNGAQFAAINLSTGVNNATLGTTHVRGVYTFAAGDVLATRIANTTAGNFQVSLQLIIEMAS